MEDTNPLVFREKNSPVTNADAITVKHISGVHIIIIFSPIA